LESSHRDTTMQEGNLNRADFARDVAGIDDVEKRVRIVVGQKQRGAGRAG